MKKNKFIIVLLLATFSGIEMFCQSVSPNWGWPVHTNQNPDHRGKIYGTPGEYRSPYVSGNIQLLFEPFPNLPVTTFTMAAGNPPRYHGGVDITAPVLNGCQNNYSNVYNIDNQGIVYYINRADDFNDRILIGNTIYWHTVIDPIITPNVDMANTNGLIGEMATNAAHVHVMPSLFNMPNHLLSLPNLVDNSLPTINANSIGYYRSGIGADIINQTTNAATLTTRELITNITVSNVVYRQLYGVADMKIDVDDVHIAPDGNTPAQICGNNGDVAPNVVGYQIVGIDNSYNYPNFNNINFSNSPSYESAIHVIRNESDPNIDFAEYFVTNSTALPYDRYWNTKHKSGSAQTYPGEATTQYNTQNAISSINAVYPDGRYTVRFFTSDARNGVQQNNTVSHNSNVFIDNFKPHVQKIRVELNGATLLQETEWKVLNDRLTKSEQEGSSGIWQNNAVVRVHIWVSEPLSSYSVVLKKSDGTVIPSTSSGSFSSKHFWIDYSSTGSSGYFQPENLYEIYVSGQDLDNNKIVRLSDSGSNAPVLPYRTPSGWSATTTENDDLYKFKFKGVCVGPGGFRGSNHSDAENTVVACDCEPSADFQELFQGGYDFSFDATGLCTGTPPLKYKWEFGDGTSSSSSEDNVEYDYSYTVAGEYDVTLTVTDDCGNTATAIKTVLVEGTSSFSVEIQGAGSCVVNQTLTFEGVISGGVPPYSYTWEALNGGSTYIPGPNGNSGVNQSTQDIKFTESTNFFTATVFVTVTDAMGDQVTAIHPLEVIETNIDVSFNHFPDSPTGNDCNSSIVAGSFLAWAADITPLFALDPPLDYTWTFSDGTVINEYYGQCEHSFATDGYHTVTLKVCNLAGGCYEGTKTYCVGSPPPPNNTYSLKLVGPSRIKWGGSSSTITFNSSSGTYCAPTDHGMGNPCNGKPKITWSLFFPESNQFVGGSTYISCPQEINDVIKLNALTLANNCIYELAYPSNASFKPWGCLSVNAYDFSNPCANGNCGNATFGASNPCIVYVEPLPLVVSDIVANQEGNCGIKLSATINGGARKVTGYVQGQYTFEEIQYKWTAFDFYHPEAELENFFIDNTDKSPSVNIDHPFFATVPASEYPLVIVKFQAVDNANQIATTQNSLTINPFRVVTKPTYGRCPKTWSYFEADRLATGGTGIFDYTWSVVSPSGGSLAFESGDIHDPLPYFESPATGQRVYQLVVNMKDATGAVLCSKTQTVTVSASPLVLQMPAVVLACNGNGATTLGPIGSNIGGSGNYDYVWTTSNENHLLLLSDIFSLNPIIQNVPSPAITYTLVVVDRTAQCTASAEVSVTGYNNDLSVTLPASIALCNREYKEIIAQTNASTSASCEWSYPTFPRPDRLTTGATSNILVISEITASHAGTYPFTVRLIHNVSGCYAEATTQVTIGSQWKHQGYEPLTWVTVAGVERELWRPNVGGKITSPDPYASGTELTTTWSPIIPTNIEYNPAGNNAKRSVRNATFIPTVSQPQVTMMVKQNSTDCTKGYKSIKYLIADSKMSLSFTIDNTPPCVSDEEVCFNVSFDLHLLPGQEGANIPMYVDVQYNMTPPSYNPGDETRTGTLRLNLVTSTGLYQNTLCIADFFTEAFIYNQYADYQPYHGYNVTFTKSDIYSIFGPQTQSSSGAWVTNESVSASQNFMVSDGQAYASDSYDGCSINYHDFVSKSYIKIGIASPIGITLPCPLGSSSMDWNNQIRAKDYIEIVSMAGSEMALIPHNHPSVASPSDFGPHLFIDPCLPPEKPGDTTLVVSRSTEVIAPISEFGLDIQPNPFTGEVTLTYTLENSEEAQEATLSVYNALGEFIKVIEKTPDTRGGVYKTVFDGSNMPSGVYLYELKSSNGNRIVKKGLKLDK